MKPVHTDYTNIILGAPSNWDASKFGECQPLPVHKSENFVSSWWSPTFWGAVKILLGHKVRVSLAGQTQVPITVEIEKVKVKE